MKDDYELLDSGDGRKLERFGNYVLARPCSQAMWRPELSESEWSKADASFDREDGNVYIGKLDNKKQRSIGVYSRPGKGTPDIALGGLECTTHSTKPISLLVHWNKSKSETEQAAWELFEKLLHEINKI